MAGFATTRASSAQLAELRKNPALPADRSVPFGFLKNSDEQTVLALATISQAIVSLNQPTDFCRHWGVVAAPNLFGRLGIYQGLCDYRKDGAWGITPHLIPHYSLHAASGTISQALKIHGPNFGIGGGPRAASEAFLIAATLLSDNQLPGLWVVLTGYEKESLPGKQETPATCLAAALALKPLNNADSTPSLQISGAENARRIGRRLRCQIFLKRLESNDSTGRWSLPGGGWVSWES